MKMHIKLTALLMAAAMSFLFPATFSDAAYQVPDKIKIGLYFRDTSAHTDTALASFSVSAAAGLQIGFFRDNAFTELYSEPTPSLLTVRKDTWFSNSGGVLKEYSPTGGTIPEGEKFGPYHVKIGADYPDQASANAQAAAYRQQGLPAYPAYADAWQVWTGFYIDEAAAARDAANFAALLGGVQCAPVQPSPDSIAVVNAANQGLCIFRSSTALFRIQPRPENNPPIFTINKVPYRGSLEVTRLKDSDMTVINVLTMREYLYGNVPPEIGGGAPAEAIKAQAVASKMYALNNLGKHKKTGFDLTATTSDQVYKGYSSERPSSNAAIDEVADKIITYEGKPASAIFYFASSGGRTEDVKNVWGSSYPYLVSVEDEYERIYSWTKTLRASDVKARIPDIGNILGMDITKTAESGRVTQLAVRGDSRSDPALYTLEKCRTVFGLNSQLYTISTDADIYVSPPASAPAKTQLGGKTVLSAAGAKKLTAASNKFTVLGAGGQKKTVPLVPENYTFSGKGNGHAVGMSQEGAIGMAQAGIKYDEILTHYFPGTKIE
jgi:stage II sporulation protein D